MKRRAAHIGFASATLTFAALTCKLIARQRDNPQQWATPSSQLPLQTQNLAWDDAQNKQRVVVLGDSIVAGLGVQPAEAWPARVQAALDEKRANQWAVINAGIAGETAVQGLLRVPRDVTRWQPHVVLIAFGLNDGNLVGKQTAVDAWRAELLRSGRATGRGSYFSRWRAKLSQAMNNTSKTRVALADYRLAVEQLIKSIRHATPKSQIALVNLTPVDKRLLPERGKSWLDQQIATYAAYNTTLAAEAFRLNVPLIDVNKKLSTCNLDEIIQEDGLHLTPAGHTILANEVLGWLEKFDTIKN